MGKPNVVKAVHRHKHSLFYATTIEGLQLYDEELFRPQTADFQFNLESPHFHQQLKRLYNGHPRNM